MSTTAPVFVGVDVSKEQLDVAIGCDGPAFSFGNEERSIANLVAELRARNAGLVVLEATSGFEVPLAAALAAAHLPLAIVNPRQVREFARAARQDGSYRRAQGRRPRALRAEWLPALCHGRHGPAADVAAAISRSRQDTEGHCG